MEMTPQHAPTGAVRSSQVVAGCLLGRTRLLSGGPLEARTTSFEELEAYALQNGEPTIASGRQEMLENLINDFI